jgi:hypothetical protein
MSAFASEAWYPGPPGVEGLAGAECGSNTDGVLAIGDGNKLAGAEDAIVYEDDRR